MIRNVVGSVVALIGAAAAVYSPFQAWYGGRHGSAYRIQDLFGGITTTKAAVAGSILLPFAFAALLTLVGLMLRSRMLVALAGVVTIGFAVLWMIRQYQVSSSLALSSSGSGLGRGLAWSLGGGLLLLVGAALMDGRHAGRRTRQEDGQGYAQGYAPEPAPAQGAPAQEPSYGQERYGQEPYAQDAAYGQGPNAQSGYAQPGYAQPGSHTGSISSSDLPPELTEPDPADPATTQRQPQQPQWAPRSQPPSDNG